MCGIVVTELPRIGYRSTWGWPRERPKHVLVMKLFSNEISTSCVWLTLAIFISLYDCTQHNWDGSLKRKRAVYFTLCTDLLMQIQGDPPGYMQVPLRHHHIHFKVEIEWSVNYPVHTQDCVIFIFLQTRLGNICVHFGCLFPKSTNPTSNCCVFLLTWLLAVRWTKCMQRQWLYVAPTSQIRTSATLVLTIIPRWNVSYRTEPAMTKREPMTGVNCSDYSYASLFDFRLTPRSKWDLSSSGMQRSVH